MLPMPEPLAIYFSLAHDATTEELGAIFKPNAAVHDEGRHYRGITAIRDWRIDTMARTPFTARPLSIDEQSDVFTVRAEINGSFPGSPLTLRHRFTVCDGRIADLEIG